MILHNDFHVRTSCSQVQGSGLTWNTPKLVFFFFFVVVAVTKYWTKSNVREGGLISHFRGIQSIMVGEVRWLVISCPKSNQEVESSQEVARPTPKNPLLPANLL